MYSPFIVEEARERHQVQIHTADEYRLGQQAQPTTTRRPRIDVRQILVALWHTFATRLTRGLPTPGPEEIW